MLLFKRSILEFSFDRHLEHIVSYQDAEWLSVFLVGEFGALEIFMQNDCFAKPDFSYLFNWKRQK